MNLVKWSECCGDTNPNAEQEQDICEYEQEIKSEGNQSLSETGKIGRYQCPI